MLSSFGGPCPEQSRMDQDNKASPILLHVPISLVSIEQRPTDGVHVLAND